MAKKILLIEDEEILANMYKLKLVKAGYEVEVARDGETGVQLTKSLKPDLVLLDIIMPKKDGFIVLEEIKSDEFTKNIPVYMLTNLGQEEDTAKGKELGAVGYFVKADMTPGELVIKINKHFKK
ncbi:MAG: response regulator transcription factor [Candidatus Komeilibacteria bacterium]